MKKILILVVCVLLTGCATIKQDQTPLLSFVIEKAGGSYVAPIAKEQWLQTEFGWYVKRNPTISGDMIEYETLVDLRDRKASILREFANHIAIKKSYPSFLYQKGEVNCRTGDNAFTETKLMEDFKTKKSTVNLREATDISKALCIFKLAVFM